MSFMQRNKESATEHFVVTHFDAYQDGTLAQTETAVYEQHLKTCRECREWALRQENLAARLEMEMAPAAALAPASAARIQQNLYSSMRRAVIMNNVRTSVAAVGAIAVLALIVGAVAWWQSSSFGAEVQAFLDEHEVVTLREVDAHDVVIPLAERVLVRDAWVGRRTEVLVDDLKRTQLVMYAGASGDYNPLHTDDLFTREVAAQHWHPLFKRNGNTPLDDGVKVKSSARSVKKKRQPPITIDYSMSPAGKEWKVFDIFTDDVSLVKNYKRQFRRVIKDEGWNGLIDRMEKKLNAEDELI